MSKLVIIKVYTQTKGTKVYGLDELDEFELENIVEELERVVRRIKTGVTL